MSEGGSMPGWSEFQSALSQLQAVSGGGGGTGGGTGGGGRQAVTAIDPVDEAYQKEGLQRAGYTVAPTGAVYDTGSHPQTVKIDPIDEAYQRPGLERAGYTFDSGGSTGTRTGGLQVGRAFDPSRYPTL